MIPLFIDSNQSIPNSEYSIIRQSAGSLYFATRHRLNQQEKRGTTKRQVFTTDWYIVRLQESLTRPRLLTG